MLANCLCLGLVLLRAACVHLQVDQYAFTSLMQATSAIDMQQQPERLSKLVQEALEGKKVVAAVYARPVNQVAGVDSKQQEQQQQQWCISHWTLA